MTENKATRHRCNDNRVNPSPTQQEALASNIVPNPWTREQCRAIELSLGGGFLLLTILAAVIA